MRRSRTSFELRIAARTSRRVRDFLANGALFRGLLRNDVVRTDDSYLQRRLRRLAAAGNDVIDAQAQVERDQDEKEGEENGDTVAL